MEMQAPWIVCRMGRKLHLLAKDEKAYYIIETGKKLDYATEEWLESQGVSEELLKELNLPFTYIPKTALRGVAIGGNEAGCAITLYLKSEKKQLLLEMDYESRWMEDFFAGISRFTPPAAKQAPKKRGKTDRDSWRREKRDPILYKKLHWVPLALSGIALLVNYGYYKTEHPVWFTLCLLVMAVPVVLDILMPAYFSLFFEEKGKERDARSLEAPMMISMIGMMLCGRINWLDDRGVWKIMLICGVISVMVCLLAEEFRREKIWLLAALFFGGVFGSFAVGHANEVYAIQEPQSYILEVEETDADIHRRNRSYYCTITLPDGREEKLHISRSLYENLEAGDLVRVEVGEGLFGFEYAIVYPYEEGA